MAHVTLPKAILSKAKVFALYNYRAFANFKLLPPVTLQPLEVQGHKVSHVKSPICHYLGFEGKYLVEKDF